MLLNNNHNKLNHNNFKFNLNKQIKHQIKHFAIKKIKKTQIIAYKNKMKNPKNKLKKIINLLIKAFNYKNVKINFNAKKHHNNLLNNF